jgi:hypothetical protein
VLARDETQIDIGHHGACRQHAGRAGACADETIEAVIGRGAKRIAPVAHDLAGKPAVEPQAGGPRNLDEPADAVDGDARRDLDFLGLAGICRPMRHLEPGKCAAAGEEGQGAGEAPAVVGLFVEEVLDVEQHAGGIGGAFGLRPGIERIGLGPARDDAHDHSFLRGRRGFFAGDGRTFPPRLARGAAGTELTSSPSE